MKSHFLVAIACLAIGISVAWVFKPDSSSGTGSTGDSAAATFGKPGSPGESNPKMSDRKPLKSNRKPGGGGANPKFATIVTSEGMSEEMNRKITTMLKKQKIAQIDARIAKLVAQLNLTDGQEAALRKATESRLEGFKKLFGKDGDPSQLGELMQSDGIDEALVDILTTEQVEEHKAVKKRERANRVEARALQELARLSDLDLTQDQKDAAYDIFYQQAEESVGDGTPAQGMLSVVTDGFGIEVNSDALDLPTAVIPANDDVASGTAKSDPQTLMRVARERMEQRINERVNSLRPVLSEAQLEQYQRSLELRQGSLFTEFLGETEVGGADGETREGE